MHMWTTREQRQQWTLRKHPSPDWIWVGQFLMRSWGWPAAKELGTSSVKCFCQPVYQESHHRFHRLHFPEILFPRTLETLRSVLSYFTAAQSPLHRRSHRICQVPHFSVFSDHRRLRLAQPTIRQSLHTWPDEVTKRRLSTWLNSSASMKPIEISSKRKTNTGID